MFETFKNSTRQTIVTNLEAIFDSPEFIYLLCISTLNSEINPIETQSSILQAIRCNKKIQDFLEKKHPHVQTRNDINGVLNNKQFKRKLVLPKGLEREDLNAHILYATDHFQDATVDFTTNEINQATKIYRSIFSKSSEITYHTNSNPIISTNLFNAILESVKSKEVEIYTLFCPDYSYESTGSNTFQFTFESIGKEIGVIAKRGITFLQHTTDSFSQNVLIHLYMPTMLVLSALLMESI